MALAPVVTLTNDKSVADGPFSLPTLSENNMKNYAIVFSVITLLLLGTHPVLADGQVRLGSPIQ